MSARDPDRKGMDTSGVVDYGAKLDRYEWTQTRGEVTCTISGAKLKEVCEWPADKALRARDLVVELTLTRVKIGLKGKPTLFLTGPFPNRINTDDSTWTWDSDSDTLELTLAKDATVHDEEKPWWPSFVTGEEEIDVDLIEGSKYLDVSLLRKVKAQKQLKKQQEEEERAEAEAKAAAAAAAAATAAAAGAGSADNDVATAADNKDA